MQREKIRPALHQFDPSIRPINSTHQFDPLTRQFLRPAAYGEAAYGEAAYGEAVWFKVGFPGKPLNRFRVFQGR